MQNDRSGGAPKEKFYTWVPATQKQTGNRKTSVMGYAAGRISSRLNGSTSKFGWLQAAATKVSSLSITSANPATIRFFDFHR